MQKSLELLKNLSFCVIDLETTGGSHEVDKMIEIGLIKIQGLHVVSEYGKLINPQIPIPDFIQKLTSITPKLLIDAPLIEHVIDEILQFIGPSILVAHNSSFDVPFFDSVLKRLKRPLLENNSICTDMMTKNLIPNIMNSNLTYMAQLFNIKHHKAHRALEDAKVTAKLFLHYLSIYANRNFTKINQIYYPRNKFEFDSITLKHTPQFFGVGCSQLGHGHKSSRPQSTRTWT